MHLIYRNVNTAFAGVVGGIDSGEIPTIRQESRNGPVLRVRDPLTITYENPRERVLVNRARDCNPFFHVVEAMWMLAGRNDVATVARYTPRMRDYSDDGETLHGAYGYRWRVWFGYDQLKAIIAELRANPDSRRCVLQMWDAANAWTRSSELGVGPRDSTPFCDCDDLYVATHGGLDVPCNLCATFQIIDGELELTVYNRSNDLIWGTLGANVVHFSFLHEYVAACAGVELGRYHQVSSNAHVYLNNWKPGEWLERAGDPYENMLETDYVLCPLVNDVETFDRELPRVVDNAGSEVPLAGDRSEPFFGAVVEPAIEAFYFHKKRNYETAVGIANRIMSADWRKACVDWLEKRERNWKSKQEATA